MLRYLVLALVSICFIEKSIAQNTVGVLNVSDFAYDGYTLFSPNFSKETYLINKCGQVVNQWTSNYQPGVSVYLLENGNLLRTGGDGDSEIIIGAPGGILEMYDWDGNLIWEYRYSSSTFSQHHDVFPLPNGNILMLAVTTMTKEEAIQAGRDPLKIVNNLYNEQILEIEPIGTNEANVVWEWNAKDHLIQDFDNLKENFGQIDVHPELININYMENDIGLANWLHINSLQYNETLDQIIISVKNLHEIYIIDHSTTTEEAASHLGGVYGRGGDLLYRWGNPEAYNLGTIDDKKLFGQHYAHWIPNGLIDSGKIMVFNNGKGRGYSSLDIINPEQSSSGVYTYNSTTGYSPNEAEWTYKDPVDSTLFFSPILSSGQRLPNGNTLICEGSSGHFLEIDPSNNIVWEYVNPDYNNGIAKQGETPNFNYVFRAQKFGVDYPAFSGKELIPGDPIEIDFDIAFCDMAKPIVMEQSPANQSIDIPIDQNELRLTFNESIEYLTGDILIKRVDDKSVVENISENNNFYIEKNVLIISLSILLEHSTAYYIEIATGAITDKAGNLFEGYNSEDYWSFITDQSPVLSVNSKLQYGSKISIYPNPNNGNFSIDLGSIYESIHIKISDAQGKLIMQADSYNSELIEIRLPKYTQPGVYFLMVESKEDVFVARFFLGNSVD